MIALDTDSGTDISVEDNPVEDISVDVISVEDISVEDNQWRMFHKGTLKSPPLCDVSINHWNK